METVINILQKAGVIEASVLSAIDGTSPHEIANLCELIEIIRSTNLSSFRSIFINKITCLSSIQSILNNVSTICKMCILVSFLFFLNRHKGLHGC